MKLGAYIQQSRKRKKILQKDLSLTVQISSQYLNDLEHDRREPSDAVLQRLVDALGFDADFAYYLIGKFPPDLRDGISKEKLVKFYRGLRKG